MKKALFLFVVGVLSFVSASAQSAPPFYVSPRGGVCDTVYNKVDVSASYPGGVEEMYYFFHKNLDPQYANKLHPNITSKRIMVKLLVSNEGKILDQKVLVKVSPEVDTAVLNVIKKFPAMVPGQVKGRKICSYYIVALNFLN
ncbi:MAG: hypothetical protein J5554_03885 [Paludibacteraceae bacterium]|nr:hypothetical protein [Paludibacteraceae bacterium]